MVQFMGDRVLKLGLRFFRIKIEEDCWVVQDIDHKAVRLRFDDRKDFGFDSGLVGEVRQYAAGRSVEIGSLPGVESRTQHRSLRGQFTGEHERSEIAVGEVAMQAGFALLQADVGFSREKMLPVGVGNGHSRSALVENRKHGFRLAGVKRQLDSVRGCVRLQVLPAEGEGSSADKNPKNDKSSSCGHSALFIGRVS